MKKRGILILYIVFMVLVILPVIVGLWIWNEDILRMIIFIFPNFYLSSHIVHCDLVWLFYICNISEFVVLFNLQTYWSQMLLFFWR